MSGSGENKQQDVGKPGETLAGFQAAQIVVWATVVIVDRKRKWMKAVDTVKIESRKLADD